MMNNAQWHAALAANLELDASRLQLSQSSTPLIAGDVELWDHLDAVPPDTLVFNRSVQSFSRFSTQHDVIVNQLGFDGEAAFQTSIGADTHRSWSDYVARLTVRPARTQLPAIFLNWAMARSPGVATLGASALARAALARDTRDVTPQRDFEGSLRDLQQKLLSSPGAKFALHLDDGTAVDVTFGAVTTWHSKPGRWYNPGAMRTAFENPKSPLWETTANSTWKDFFGPDGKMARAIESLVVVDGITATVNSSAVNDAADPAGLWPFYIQGNEAAKNHVEFDASGNTQLRLTKIGNPAVIGNLVVSIAQYLG